jgi:glycosyltransferase involved in cell wall biosynthesis
MGGAERQAYYIVRALKEAGVNVRVFSLYPGEAYEGTLREMGVESKHFGWVPGLPLRIPILLAQLRRFRPHVVQSVHAFTNVYSGIAGRVLGAVSVGGLRSDLQCCLRDNGPFSRFLLTLPDAVAANSHAAIREVVQSQMLDPSRLHLLSNAIDLNGFSGRVDDPDNTGDCTCICITRLVPLKRVDIFLRALVVARKIEPRLRGVVAGAGPESERLHQIAAELGLSSEALRFLGPREDIADLLRQSTMFVFCSESEGSPNVVLEAMATGIPVITTPAGDAADVVESAGAGLVVPFGDVNAVANSMVQLARSAELRRTFGAAGRRYITSCHDVSQLAEQLLKIYAKVARTTARGRRNGLLECVAACLERV